MKYVQWIALSLSLCLIHPFTYAQTYLEKFQQFMVWNIALPTTPDPQFIEFISQKTPLSQKLRGRWLYQLALKKDWQGFLNYYQHSNDVSLQCYEQLARVNLGKEEQALPIAKSLWLQSTSQPPSCNVLFSWLLKTHDPKQELVTQRLSLALENRNIGLATHLLQLYKPPHFNDGKILMAIHQKPERINELTPGGVHGDFYLYGLKRMVSNNHMDEAIRYWEKPKARQLLSQKQSQAFLNFLVIYKAMRNSDDTPLWFAKIQPKNYTDLLLDWEIRYALKRQQWGVVARLIPQSPQKNDPCWRYWLARAFEAQGKKDKAQEIYQPLARTRHYYGFLASVRLRTKPSFANEPTTIDKQRLTVYKPITDEIRSLYNTHKILQASLLLNDFASELPKADKSALIQWVQDDLKWQGKAVYLSNTDDLNDQLTLRFPLAHRQVVLENSKHYQIPQELIYAVIRQESGFREDVISPAGAHGLMQIMPATAQKVAEQQKIAYNHKNQLFSSTHNIKIGTAYLQQLDKRYNHHPVLMAAAYNAGPTQVNYWLKNHPPKHIDIWIETLPWRETRNYIKNIIAFYAVYQYRVSAKSDLSWFMKQF